MDAEKFDNIILAPRGETDAEFKYRVSEMYRKIDKCKMFAQHPFEEARILGDGVSLQIVGVNFANQTVILRDFYEYDVDELELVIEIEQ